MIPEINLVNPHREEIIEAIMAVKAARQQDSTNVYLNMLWNKRFKSLEEVFNTSTPYVYGFVYSPYQEDGVVIKGYLQDVEQFIVQNYGNAVVHLLIHKSGQKTILKENKVWRGYGNVLVSSPKPAITKTLRQEPKQSKYIVQIGNRSFEYKRMPAKWLSEWTTALKTL